MPECLSVKLYHPALFFMVGRLNLEEALERADLSTKCYLVNLVIDVSTMQFLCSALNEALCFQ